MQIVNFQGGEGGIEEEERNTYHGFNIISKKQVLFLVVGIILFIGVYSVGAMLVKIDYSEAQIIKR